MRRLAMLAAALAFVGATASAWLHFSTRQMAQDEALLRESAERTRAVNDALLVQGVGAGLSNRDYGEVQEALDRFVEAGCRCRAIAVNSADKVVASTGLTPPPRIGEPAPEPMRAGMRAIEVTHGGERNGRLFLAPLESPAPPSGWRMLDTMRGLARGLALFALLATVGAILLAWRSRLGATAHREEAMPTGAAATPAPEPAPPPGDEETDERIRQHLAKLRERRQQRAASATDRADAA
jgi:uncharacterized iron-regulated membrane protein